MKQVNLTNLPPVRKLQEPALPLFTKVSPGQRAPETPLKRLTLIERKELLKQSALNKPTNNVIESSSSKLPLLGQIHADALAINNSLQNLPPHEGARVWARLSEQVTEVTIPQNVQNSLNQYAETSAELANMRNVLAQATSIAQKVHALQPGESFLLEGGRKSGFVQCPIVYEWIRISEELFELFVYLPGNSKGTFHEQVQERGKKDWNRPVIHYPNIPAASHIFFGKEGEIKPDLFQAILEARFNSNQTTKFVTLDLLAHLQAFRSDQPTPPVMSERRALTDAWFIAETFYVPKTWTGKL